MPYMGKVDVKASDIKRFSVTGSTSATHTLSWTAPSEQALIITINGVKQQDGAYTISGTPTTITLSSALVATDEMEVIGINDIGQTNTVAQDSIVTDMIRDDAVTTAKIADDQVTSAKLDTNIAIDGDLTVDTSTLHVDSTNNRVGIGTSSPAHKLDVLGNIASNTGGSNSQIASVSNAGSLSLNARADISMHLIDATVNSLGVRTLAAQPLFFATNGTERMRIDSSGRVTMPYQPAMTIAGNQNAYATLVTSNGISSTVPFNSVISGNGYGFNTSTHTFTAPIAGNYFISFWGLYSTSIANNEIQLYKNGSLLYRCFTGNYARGTTASAVVLSLSANDYFQIISNYPLWLSNSSGNSYSGLSITLLS